MADHLEANASPPWCPGLGLSSTQAAAAAASATPSAGTSVAPALGAGNTANPGCMQHLESPSKLSETSELHLPRRCSSFGNGGLFVLQPLQPPPQHQRVMPPPLDLASSGASFARSYSSSIASGSFPAAAGSLSSLSGGTPSLAAGSTPRPAKPAGAPPTAATHAATGGMREPQHHQQQAAWVTGERVVATDNAGARDNAGEVAAARDEEISQLRLQLAATSLQSERRGAALAALQAQVRHDEQQRVQQQQQVPATDGRLVPQAASEPTTSATPAAEDGTMISGDGDDHPLGIAMHSSKDCVNTAMAAAGAGGEAASSMESEQQLQLQLQQALQVREQQLRDAHARLAAFEADLGRSSVLRQRAEEEAAALLSSISNLKAELGDAKRRATHALLVNSELRNRLDESQSEARRLYDRLREAVQTVVTLSQQQEQQQLERRSPFVPVALPAGGVSANASAAMPAVAALPSSHGAMAPACNDYSGMGSVSAKAASWDGRAAGGGSGAMVVNEDDLLCHEASLESARGGMIRNHGNGEDGAHAGLLVCDEGPEVYGGSGKRRNSQESQPRSTPLPAKAADWVARIFNTNPAGRSSGGGGGRGGGGSYDSITQGITATTDGLKPTNGGIIPGGDHDGDVRSGKRSRMQQP